MSVSFVSRQKKGHPQTSDHQIDLFIGKH